MFYLCLFITISQAVFFVATATLLREPFCIAVNSIRFVENVTAMISSVMFRDAPIIGRFADNRNRPITMPVSADCYLLCITMALDIEIILCYLNG